ncbi:hypothetical protein A1OW_10340 [Enterovibrio norvegicus]|uniref:phage holin family protein n=1 Tax=Enterovibrio norvegicus TaxID=188144 RepID=UPI00036158D5|nr:phage holin family protein [Enterovibrio norvegicus]OEF50991.1 hypothetical protein A1OW_10340 [Enterovibrio norvegicus]
MPDKDPNTYSALTMLAFAGTAIWGGLVTHIQHIRRHNKRFVLREALMQTVVSGFAGMLAVLLCSYLSAPAPMAGFFAGTAGFMGTRALTLFERKFAKFLD